MNGELTVILYALAIFRMAEMLVIDDGPFDVLVELRGWLNAGEKERSIRRVIGAGFSCVYCAGIWVSLIFSFFYFYGNSFTEFFVIWLALAGSQSILSKKLGRS